MISLVLLTLTTGVLSLDNTNSTLQALDRRADSRELWRHTTFHSGSSMLSGFNAEHTWGSLDVASDPAGGSGHVLRVHYAEGSYSHTKDIDRGAGFYAKPTSHHTAMMLSYDVYFSSNFDFVKGGKLPGLWGGTNTCTGGHHSDDCFTTRFMWRANGEGEVYAYIPKEQDSHFCSRSDVVCDSTYGYSLGRGHWHLKKGVWQNLAQYVHLNTPGRTDGYIRVYLNGKQVYEIRDIAIRNKSSLNIDGIAFYTFFGGSDKSWASTRSCYSYFKNFVLSMDATHPVIIG